MGVSYFLSDIHIKNNQDLSYLKLTEFFDTHWKQNPGNIYLLGDIFDLWVAHHQVFINLYKSLIDRLIHVKSLGYKIIYFEGNHDLHLTSYWQKQLGFEVQKDIEYYDIDGWRFRLEHGDLINQNDEDYLRLRRFLRNPYMTFLAHNVPGVFWDWLGKKWSQQSRKATQNYRIKNTDEIIHMIREYAKSEVMKADFDVLISGHMHVKDIYEFEYRHKKRISINLGSWFEEVAILKFESQNKINLKENFAWIKI